MLKNKLEEVIKTSQRVAELELNADKMKSDIEWLKSTLRNLEQQINQPEEEII